MIRRVFMWTVRSLSSWTARYTKEIKSPAHQQEHKQEHKQRRKINYVVNVDEEIECGLGSQGSGRRAEEVRFKRLLISKMAKVHGSWSDNGSMKSTQQN